MWPLWGETGILAQRMLTISSAANPQTALKNSVTLDWDYYYEFYRKSIFGKTRRP